MFVQYFSNFSIIKNIKLKKTDLDLGRGRVATTKYKITYYQVTKLNSILLSRVLNFKTTNNVGTYLMNTYILTRCLHKPRYYY